MDVAEAPAAEESLLARLVAAVDIRGVGSLTRAELGEAARLRGPSSKNLDLAAAGPEPYALADAARLLRPLGWEAARLEEDVAKVERSAAVFRSLDASQSGFLELKELRAALTAQAGHALRLAGLVSTLDSARNGKVSWLEFLAGVTSERFGERFASFRDWALETAPLHIFSDIDIDVGVGDEALKELSFLERLPCYVVQATFRKQARRKVRPGDARESDAPATARDLAAIDASVRRALLFGVCCGVGAALLVAYLTPYSLGARRRAHLLLLRLAASLVVSGVEVLLIYACCVDVACAIARRCRLRLWPLDFERALTTAALARAALEIPHPVRPCLGIDPMRHLSGLRLYAVQLLYAGKRGISLFLLKLLLKKVVARVFLKGLGDRAGLDLALVVAVNALWNLLMVAGCVRSAKVCCFGLPAATGAIHAAIDRRETRARTPLDLATKELALRAAAAAAVPRGTVVFHPNHFFALQYLERLLADDALVAFAAKRPPELVDDGASRGARDHARLAVMELDDENRFFAGLAAAEPASADLALELFAAMLVLDGRVARGTRGGNARRMGRVLEVAGRHVPRNDVARALRHCVAVFTSGLGLCARDLVLAAGADAAGLPRCEAAEPRTADALLGYLAVDYCC